MKNINLKNNPYNIYERLGANISKDVNNFMNLWKWVWPARKKGGDTKINIFKEMQIWISIRKMFSLIETKTETFKLLRRAIEHNKFHAEIKLKKK